MLPSLREKKRYLVFEVLSDKKFNFQEINTAVWDATLAFLGELGASKAGIILLGDKWNQKKQRGLIRVDRKYVDNIKVALALITKINSENVVVKSVGVSGVIGKAEKRFLLGTI